ncbi:MAG: hypothetical protein FWH29_02710 [Methanobrevibacter sp.]|nr:hypothetical protein [Methanobrevibacter sp.]
MSSKKERKIIVTVIIALIAFAVGSGIGISVGFAQNDNATDYNTTNNTIPVNNITNNNVTNVTNASNASNLNDSLNGTGYETAVIYYSPEDLANNINISK